MLSLLGENILVLGPQLHNLFRKTGFLSCFREMRERLATFSQRCVDFVHFCYYEVLASNYILRDTLISKNSDLSDIAVAL